MARLACVHEHADHMCPSRDHWHHIHIIVITADEHLQTRCVVQNHSLLMELLTDEGVGTMIVGSSRATSIHQQEQQIREAVAA